MDVNELLKIIKRANIATVLSQQMQHSKNITYKLLFPSQLSEQWVQDHVHPVYMDDEDAILDLKRSAEYPADKWARIESYRQSGRSSGEFYGYELRAPVEKSNSFYQNNEAQSGGKTATLFHSTRQGLLHNILKHGVHASIESHGTDGFWAFALSTVRGYDWGRTDFETMHGCMLELKAPLTFCDGYTGALQHNARIASTGAWGHLRWVVPGKHKSTSLPVMITHVKFLLPTAKMLHYKLQLRTAIKNSVYWSFGYSWGNYEVGADDVPFAPWIHKYFGKRCSPGCNLNCRKFQSALLVAEPKSIGEQKKKKDHGVNAIASDVVSLVERRINYASGTGLAFAFKYSFDNEDDAAAIGILQTGHDISVAAVSLSADIAKVLYPLIAISPVQATGRFAFWRGRVSRKDVPLPLLLFLDARFPNTDWKNVFMRGDPHVKDMYHSKNVSIPPASRDIATAEPRTSSPKSPQPMQIAASSSSNDQIVTDEPRASSPKSPQPIEIADSPSSDDQAELPSPDGDSIICHYTQQCGNKPCFAVRMKSKNAKPRWRWVCLECCHWLEGDRLVVEVHDL